MTTTSAPVELRRSRGFGDQINVTFAFLRENYKKLGKCVLYICGPPAVLAGILVGSNWLATLGDLDDLGAFGGGGISAVSVLALVLGVIIGMLSGVLMIGVINNYVFLYLERGADGFEFEDVWQAARASIGKIFLTALGIGFFGIAIYVLWIGLVVATGLFGAVLGLVLMVAILYFAVALSPLFTVRLYEDVGLGESISRCMELVKGNWWLTCGVLLVIYMVSSFMASVLAIPAYIIMAIAALNAESGGGDMGDMGGYMIIATVFLVLYMIASYIVSSLPVLASVLHYYNLVEKSEGVGMLQKIDAIGREDEPGGLDTNSF